MHRDKARQRLAKRTGKNTARHALASPKNPPEPLKIRNRQELEIRWLVGQVPDLPRRNGSQPH
jgi:hypothetical protein